VYNQFDNWLYRVNGVSALSALLFVIVMGEFRDALPWVLLYADELVVIAESKEELIKTLIDGRMECRVKV